MVDEPIQPENKPQRPMTRIAIKPPASAKKSETARIDLTAAKPPPSIIDKANLPESAPEIFSRNTMRIDSPAGGDKKSETARIELPPEAEKRKTAKIDLANVPDIFKSTTMAIGLPATPPAATPSRPKSVLVKRPGAPAAVPGEQIVVSPETTAGAMEQARKSETARIDLSAEELERPTGRQKTIRIKRPDGATGRKPLSIARPAGGEAAAAEPSTISAPVEADSGEEEPDLLTGILAIAATLVAGVLFYVLLAQTVATTLPFPGRI